MHSLNTRNDPLKDIAVSILNNKNPKLEAEVARVRAI
jgi:hypothetical protein